MEDRFYEFWINNIPGIGRIKENAIRGFFDSAKDAYMADEETLAHIEGLSARDIEAVLDKEVKERAVASYAELKEKGVKMALYGDPSYPVLLNEIYDAPSLLYYKGEIRQGRMIGIVGSRRSSAYGRGVAEELGRLLASQGFIVVSGMALGIDCFAHSGALAGGGITYAVLAGGADEPYPASNSILYDKICTTGAAISEFAPGTPTTPGLFPLRNRIIAGMCEAIIVVEAGVQSGSLITANYAIEYNRRIFAVPGRIGDRMSLGCNELIGSGAEIVTGFEMLMYELGSGGGGVDLTSDMPALNDCETKIFGCLSDHSVKSLETLIYETGLSAALIYTGVMNLEIKGLIREVSKNMYARAR